MTPEEPEASPPPSSSTSDVRPSQADRMAIADRLRLAVDEGRIDLAEYESRLRQSDTVTTLVALSGLVADLPTAPSASEHALVQIGEITVTQSTAYTPVGLIPIRGSQWQIQDQWLTERRIPRWAIVLSIVGFFCLTVLSLLFLLFKETRFHGTCDVSIINGNQHYVTRIPVSNQRQIQHIYQQVNYVRALSAS